MPHLSVRLLEVVSNIFQCETLKLLIVLFVASSLLLDDGVGFGVEETRQSTGHFGIVGMRERLEQMGGSLCLISRHSQGTRVIADLPLAHSRTILAP